MRDIEKPLVASITVAWNGAGTICKHLEALKQQTVSLEEIVVVDNASSDETVNLVRRDFPTVNILAVKENLGVGGGFAIGLEYALKKNYQWFWLFDQDSVPDSSALEKLLGALKAVPAEAERIGVVAPLPIDRECGFEHVGGIWRDGFVRPSPEQVRSPVFFVDSVISSGSLIHRVVLERVGFPRADFFMDWVDNEYNLRIRNQGFKIAQVRASLIYHRQGQTHAVISFFRRKPVIRLEEPVWRRYFMARNETFVCWHQFGTTKSRLFLVIRLLRRTASNMWHEQNKLENLHMALMGFWHGYTRNFSRRAPPGAKK